MAEADSGMHSQQSNKWRMPLPLFVFFKDVRNVFKMDSLGSEILQMAVPAALALAADPVASLIDTAFIGRLGPVELAAVGVSIALFNQASRISIYPIVGITTSFVAEEETLNARVSGAGEKTKNENSDNTPPKKGGTVKDESKPQDDTIIENLEKGASTNIADETKQSAPEDDSNTTTCKFPPPVESQITTAKLRKGKRHVPSASTALIMGLLLGIMQAIILIGGAKPLLYIMGVKSDSPMLAPALKYLILKSLGSPAVLLSLAMQGIFRGFKDTKTPLYATVVGDLTNIILDPILIFVCRLGVSGAAIAHVVSQYLMFLILFWRLIKQVYLLPPSLKALQFSRFLKNGFLLLARVIAVTMCVTLATSMAARLGPTPMAGFQICLQVWLTSSLLADGLAVAGQAILASAFAEKDYKTVTTASARVLQMGFVLGLGLAAFTGAGLFFGSGIFTKDAKVIYFINLGIPIVAGTQPLNSLSFVFDGVIFGASDFAYSAYSMVLVAIASIASVFVLAKSNGYIGIWVALTIYMALRTFAGVWRMGTATGPWRFLKGRLLP